MMSDGGAAEDFLSPFYGWFGFRMILRFSCCYCFLLVSILLPATAPADLIDVVSTGQQSASSASGISANVDADRLLKPAIEAFQTGRAEDFRTAYASVKDQIDDLPEPEVFRAKLQIESGRFGDALTGLDQFLIRSPDNPEGYLALGEIAFRTQRLTDAEILLAHAKRLCDDGKLFKSREKFVLPGLLKLRAEVAERRQQWDAADGFYADWIALDSAGSEALWRRGRLGVLKGDVDQGVAAMTQARSKDANLPSPEMTAATILATGKDDSQAEKWFQAAIKADRGNVAFWAPYLKWLLVHDRPTEVRQLIEKLAPEVRTDRTISIMEGLTARYLNDLDAAETLFTSLYKANADDLEVADQLALVLVESKDEGKRARAFQIAETNLRKVPNIENTVATAAWVQFKLGSVDVADRLLGELASRISISPQTAYYVSQVLKAKGNEADALKVLEMAVNSPGIFVERESSKAALSKQE